MKVSYKDLIISPKDSRTLTFSGSTDTIIPRYFNEEIVSLKTKNFEVSVGQVFPVGKQKYKVNTIVRKLVGSKIIYDLSTGPLTAATMFIFPMFKGDKHLYMYDSLFVNCFIGTPKHKKCIALLYRFSGDATFLKFEQALSKFEGFIEASDPSHGYVMFTFKVPEEHLADYNHFVNGKYSKMDPRYKNKILSFHEFGQHGELAQILYKTNERKLRLEKQLGVKLSDDAELHSIIDIDKETFDPSDYS